MLIPPTARALARQVWVQGFTPRLRPPIVEWTEENFFLSPETTPGLQAPKPFRFKDVPYLREIVEALADPDVREVTFAKAAQVAGTTAGLIWTAYSMKHLPQPMLVGWPSEMMLRAHSLKRLDPMIRDCPELLEMFPESGRRESDNSIASKSFPYGYLQLVTSKSTIQMRSLSAGWLAAEELDEWEGDVGGQGDSLTVFRARASTIAKYKFYKTSTPTLEGGSRVWQELERSSWGLYHVPCPRCGFRQHLSFHPEWPAQAGEYNLVFDRDDHGDLVYGSTRYICRECEGEILESEKGAMLNAGAWVHRRPDRRRQHTGYHLSQLETTLVSWDSVAEKFLDVKGGPFKLKTFVNTVLGLPFKFQRKEIPVSLLQGRAEEYGADVPCGVGLLTAFTDIQGSTIQVFIEGWGAGEENWKIDWIVIDGDAGQDETWDKLAEALWGQPRVHARGAKLLPGAVAIDANYQSRKVHAFCQRYRNRGAFPTIGKGGRDRPLLKAPGPMTWKKARFAQSPNYYIAVDVAKDEILSGRLHIKTPGPKYVHFPLRDPFNSSYYEQLLAEHEEPVYVNRRPEIRWVKTPGKNNEALDGAVGNYACLHKLGPKLVLQLGEMAERLNAMGPEGGAATTTRPGRRVRSSGVQG